MILYHVTTTSNESRIIATGFKGRRKVLGKTDRGNPGSVQGVWFSDRPLWAGGYIQAQDLPAGWTIIAVDFSGITLRKWEIITEGSVYREWCIPSRTVNKLYRRQRPSEDSGREPPLLQ